MNIYLSTHYEHNVFVHSGKFQSLLVLTDAEIYVSVTYDRPLII